MTYYYNQIPDMRDAFLFTSDLPAYYCCNRKSRAACAQSLAPWQQAAIEITRRDHSRCHR